MDQKDKLAAEFKRQRIEELQNKNKIESFSLLSEEEIQKLIYELHVYQVELEMQNDELIRAKEQADTAIEKYAGLYDFAPSGYFTLSDVGEIVELNLFGAQMLGRDRNYLKNKLFGFFVSAESKPVFTDFLEKLFNNYRKESCELTLITNHHSPIDVHLTGIVNKNGNQCLLTAIDISESKTSKVALLESMELYSDLVSNQSAGIYRILVQTLKNGNSIVESTSLEYANERFYDLFEIDSSLNFKDINSSVIDKIHPDELDEFIRLNEIAQQSIKPFLWEGRLLLDKRIKWVRFESTPRKLEDGSIRWTGFVVDITGQKEMELELRKSNDMHKAILLSAIDGFCLLNIKGQILEVNETYCRMSGYCEQELLTMSIQDLESEETIDLIKLHIQQICEQGCDTFESKHKSKDGSWFDVELNIQYQSFEGGRFVVFIHDITKRKLAEKALLEREARLNQTHEIAHLGSWELNLATQKLIWSDEVYRIFGVDPKELNVNHSAFMEFVHPEDREALEHAYFTSVRDEMEGYEIEHRIIRRNTGEIRYVHEKCNHLRDGSGKTIGSVGMVQDITELRLALDALKRSESLLRTTQKITKVGGWEWNIEKKTMFWTEELYHLHDFNSADFVLGSIEHRFRSLECYLPEDRYIVNEAYTRCLEKMESQSFELPFKTAAGRRLWVRSLIEPVIENGKVISVSGIVMDITAQRRAERLLRENEEIFKCFLEYSPVYVFFKDYNIRSLRLSRNYEQLLGKPIEDLLDKNMNDLFPSELAKKMIEDDQRVIREGKMIKVDEELNGRFYTTLKFPINTEGNPGYLAGFTIDITDQKLAEKELIESRELYRDLVELAVDGVLVGSNDGIIIDANSCLCSMLGINRDSLIGTYFGNLVFTRDSLKKYPTQLNEIELGGVTMSERNILRPDGNEVIIEIRTKMMPNGTYQSIFRDITRRKIAETELKRKNLELQRINAEKDKYFSIIAHDLRSPLSGLLGLTQLMARGLHRMTLDEINDLTVLLSNSATNLFRLLSNLLEWSRMQRGLIKPLPTSILLKPEIDESLVTVVENANHKNITIEINIAAELRVFSDKIMLDTILRNLTSNGVKFTKKGGNVTVSARLTRDNMIEISIADSGIGMSKKMINNLFRLDVNTNRRGTEGELSTGLGLMICKDFVQILGGKLWVESEEGKGTIAHFTLPVNEYNIQTRK